MLVNGLFIGQRMIDHRLFTYKCQ